MNCWKTINISKDYGFYRLSFLSILSMIIAFIIIYLPINFIFPTTHFKEVPFLLFIFLLIGLVPFHKFLHIVPLLLSGNRMTYQWKVYLFIPTIRVKPCYSTKKLYMLLSLMTPFITVTTLFTILGFHFPSYIHYFCIATAFHIGICISDFIFIKQILKAPRKCYIEEFEDSFEVLINK
ncbi:DUF3267 domain-containing protein [Metabacillus fastidiosus]|uniref:DUF3267 domain-containing protein n=1 Tax=Metabacillus fastidiosus TaxID=1458 RepID=UPI003D2B1A8D